MYKKSIVKLLELDDNGNEIIEEKEGIKIWEKKLDDRNRKVVYCFGNKIVLCASVGDNEFIPYDEETILENVSDEVKRQYEQVILSKNFSIISNFFEKNHRELTGMLDITIEIYD